MKSQNRALGKLSKFALVSGSFLSVLLCLPAAAQIAEQVVDLEEIERFGGGSGPSQFTRVGDRIVFFAQTRSTGTELWTTNGSGLGTRLLTDSCPGRCGAEPEILGLLGNVVLWFSESELETPGVFTLWRSDGTRSGTFPLILQAEKSTQNSRTARGKIGDVIVFPLRDGTGHWALWRSDGTESGTFQISSLSQSTRYFVPLGQRIYFFDSFTLRSSDGTTEGTRVETELEGFTFLRKAIWAAGGQIFSVGSRDGKDVLLSFTPGSQETQTFKFVHTGQGDRIGGVAVIDSAPDRVFFHAKGGDGGIELWQSKGSPSSTHQLTEIENLDPFDEIPGSTNIQVFGDVIVIRADTEDGGVLLSSEGSSETTRVLVSHGQDEIFFQTGKMARVGDKAVFAGTHPEFGIEIWSTDGTESGTNLLKDLCPGPCDALPQIPTEPKEPVVAEEDILFIANGVNGSKELWVTDGSESGTQRIATISLGFLQGLDLARLRDQFVFAGSDEIHGREPWVTDGTPPGTKILLDLTNFKQGSEPSAVVPLADGVAFAGTTVNPSNSERERNLWFSMGTSHEPIRLSEFPDAIGISNITSSQGLSYMTRGVSLRGPQLWRSDGTADGTFELLLLEERRGGISPFIFEVLDLRAGSSFMTISGESTGIWLTDGTPSGTTLTVDFDDLGLLFPSRRWPVRDVLFFAAARASAEAALFVTDGTANGTRSLDVSARPDRLTGFAPLGDETFFFLRDPDGSSKLWHTRGTALDTRPVTNGPSFGGYSQTVELVSLNGALFFVEESVASSGDVPRLFLWRTDGTGTGTVPISELAPFDSSLPNRHNLAASTSALFFTNRDDQVGNELWVSDGTANGTRLLKDIRPGKISSAISEPTPVGSRLYYVANDGVHGQELWVSDGTEQGTRMVHDINPGGTSSTPQDLRVIGNQLYFSADDGLSGRELWVLPLNASGPPCRATSTALCLQDERFKVEAQWTNFQGRTGNGQAVPLTEDTGYFWFFNDENVEAILKVLDGQGINEHFWTFYGALSNVEYWLTVTDAETGLTRRYFNPSRQFASVGDTESFGPQGASLFQAPEALASTPAIQPLVVDRQAPEQAIGEGCTPSEVRMCLNEGRFAVEATWADFSGNAGVGQAVNLTDDTGYFWFFNDQNVETVLKVLDGRASNNAYWVFYGSLSNVDFDITVTDTQSGEVRTYQNRSRQFASVGDTEAFPQP